MSLIVHDVPSVIAASKCWLAHWSAPGFPRISVNHPDECGWCAYGPDLLLGAVEEFWRWSGSAAAAEAFDHLPRSTQQRLVREAQIGEAA